MAPRTDDMPNRSRPQAEAQLVILYLLKGLDSATDANMLEFLTETQLMNYMEMMPALGKLTQEGAIAESLEGAYRRYVLKPTGEEMLDLYGSRLPYSVRETLDLHMPEWLAALRAQRDYKADMAQTPKGDYEVSLRMMERDKAMMTVSVTLPSAEIAAKLCSRWQSEGGAVFRALLKPLLEEDQL